VVKVVNISDGKVLNEFKVAAETAATEVLDLMTQMVQQLDTVGD
jgi:hypothetical protein